MSEEIEHYRCYVPIQGGRVVQKTVIITAITSVNVHRF